MLQCDHPQEQSGFTAFAKHRWMELFLLIFAPLYLYANLFIFPNTPFLIEGDQTFFWQYALRMLHGEHVYKDFFQFTPPGLDLFYLSLFKLFGSHVLVMNAASILLGTTLCWTCFLLAKRLMTRSQALVTAFLFLVLVYGGHLDATHHWFSLLVALCSIRVLMPARTTARVAAAGALAGLASFFTQTSGCAAAVALLFALLWSRAPDRKPWKIVILQQILLVCAFGVTWFALSLHFIASVGWRDFCYFQIIYPLHHVDTTRGFLFPTVRGTLVTQSLRQLGEHLFVYCLLLLTYPFALWTCWRRRLRGLPQDQNTQVALLAIMGQLLFLAIITRLNWARVYAASMPAVILFMWVLAQSKRNQLRRCTTIAMCFLLAGLAITQIRSRHRQPRQIAELPAGRAALSHESYEEYSWLMQHTRPGDYFLQASWPNIYPPLDLRSPVFVEGLWPDQVPLPEYGALALQQVEQKQAKYILWTSLWNAPANLAHQEGYFTTFRDYLTSHYTRVHVFSNQDEIWQRL
jgi:Dolichyl-phosphate-mannose-protein mannosyltransferase